MDTTQFPILKEYGNIYHVQSYFAYFGVKYFNNKDVNHLIHALQQHYKPSIDQEGNYYWGFTLNWNNNNNWVDITMPEYFPAALKQFQHNLNNKSKHTPYQPLLTYSKNTINSKKTRHIISFTFTSKTKIKK